MTHSRVSIPNTDFAGGIAREYPDLAHEAAGDFRRVCMLRQWAWAVTDHAPTTEAAKDFDADVAWRKSDAPDFFARFAREEGGCICGSAAVGLQKLYEYFGYRAWAMTTGCGGWSTHSVALVEIRDGDTDLIVLQDSSFNETYVDASTRRPLDFFDLLARLRDRQHDTIAALAPDVMSVPRWPRMVIKPQFRGDRSIEEWKQWHGYLDESNCLTEVRGDGTVVFVSPRSRATWLRKRCYDPQTGEPVNHLKDIVDQGYPPRLIYQHRMPIKGDGVGFEELLARAKEVSLREK